jgi:hypothetical protein
MKMARSRTRKKSVRPPNSQIRKLTNVATDYIKQWTERELGKLRVTQPSPVCIPVNNGYRIGLYHVHINPNKTCDVLDHNREFVHRFESKISAILYTIYTIKRQYWTADQILCCDREINKHYMDVLSLRNSIEKAKQRKDYIIVDTRISRLEIAEGLLNLARDRILKMHKTAKYYKIWE